MKKLEKLKAPLIVLVLALLVVGYYIYLTHRPVNNTEDPGKTDSVAYEVLSRDLNKNYPGTPKSVVAYYGDILKIIYQYELTSEEYKGIVEHLRGIFDEELLSYNDYESYYLSLQGEIESYKNNKMYVADYSVEDGYGIVYKTLEDKHEYAYVDAKLFIRSGKQVTTINEEFTLRKDDDGKWKLLTWKSTDSGKE